MILLLRAKHHAGEFRVRGRARVMLRLQAKGLLICMGASRFSVHTVLRKEIRRIKLHAGLGGEHLQDVYKRQQLRIAETEKYAHVTFFFNGGVEAPFEGEDRALINSPKVATYDLQPEMSAYLVADERCV